MEHDVNVLLTDPTGVDLVQFTGGSDVDPRLYREPRHPRTQSNPERDRAELVIYEAALAAGVPCAGICRGGQFLNVVNGGRMWQHVSHHATGDTHPAIDVITAKKIEVTSTHHQMMRPADNGQLVLVADLGGFREFWSDDEWREFTPRLAGGTIPPKDMDVEAVFYEDTKCFCFQPHPEFGGHWELADHYFNYLHDYLEV